MRFIVVLAGLLVAVALAAAPAASAHAVRIAADPADGARLTAGPAQVSATFNEPLQTAFAAMTVVGPDDNLWSAGDPKIDGAVVRVALRPLGPVGTYTVNYRVTSADGHVVTGSWAFELTTPGSGTPGPAPAPPAETGGPPVWPFVAATIAAVAIAAAWAVRRSKRD